METVICQNFYLYCGWPKCIMIYIQLRAVIINDLAFLMAVSDFLNNLYNDKLAEV